MGSFVEIRNNNIGFAVGSVDFAAVHSGIHLLKRSINIAQCH